MNSIPSPCLPENALYDAVGEIMMTLDSDLRIQWANQKAGDVIREHPERLVGRFCYQSIHGRKRPCEECPVSRTLRTGQAQETDKATPDGFWYNVRSYPVISRNGSLDGVTLIGLDISDRKRTEAEIWENKRFFELITDNMFDMVSVTDMQGTIEYVGKSHEILGYDLDYLIGRNVLDFVHPEDRSFIEKELDRFVRHKVDGHTFEYRYMCRDNSYLWLETIGKIIEDTNSASEKVLFSTRDITDRKQSEEQNEFLSTLIENIYDSVVVTDADFQITYINKRTEELFGYKLNEIKGVSPFTFHAGSRSVEIKQDLYETVQSGKIYIGEDLKRKKDGSSFVCEFRVMPLLNESGKPYCYVGIQRDVTERKKVEEALRQSENYYRTIFETSGSALFIIEEDTTVSDANSNFERLTGYSKQEVKNRKSAMDFVHSDDADKIKKYHSLRRQDASSAPRQYEIRIITRQGDKKDAFISVDMIPGTSRSVASVVDISKRKQMEERLRELSIRDSLTGLYNRNFFEEEMARLSDGRHSPVGIVVCDLDGLKFVNDTLGHQSGDRLLLKVADILRKNFRTSDIIARIGGDEFAILFTNTDWQMIDHMLQRLRQAVESYNNADPEIPLSLSVGQAVGETIGPDMYALFREADNRMYREKIQREGSARSAILQALTVSMEVRDFNTEGHCDRLRELSLALARSLELSQDFENDLALLARFHDLGKVGIPDHILYKPEPLTDEEWRQMRQHCEIGHRIASSVPDLEPVADLILKHHERWDGRGYPMGVSGRDIPLACRILAIADAYDAMTSNRPYQETLSPEEARDELRRCAGTQFDPELVEQFIEIIQ